MARDLDLIFELHETLPRQGPGDTASTLRALALCAPLPEAPRVVDMGCGSGAATVVLAQALPRARLTAVDLHGPYLDDLRGRATAQGVVERLDIRQGHMAAVDLPLASVDLLWAEGSAFVLGFTHALDLWRPLLAPQGRLALTELTWLRPDPPAELRDFWAMAYPAMTDTAGNLAHLRAAGYQVLGSFALPATAFRDSYYVHLGPRLEAFAARHAEDVQAQALVAYSRQEMDMHARYADWFGYVFYVARLAADAD